MFTAGVKLCDACIRLQMQSCVLRSLLCALCADVVVHHSTGTKKSQLEWRAGNHHCRHTHARRDPRPSARSTASCGRADVTAHFSHRSSSISVVEHAPENCSKSLPRAIMWHCEGGMMAYLRDFVKCMNQVCTPQGTAGASANLQAPLSHFPCTAIVSMATGRLDMSLAEAAATCWLHCSGRFAAGGGFSLKYVASKTERVAYPFSQAWASCATRCRCTSMPYALATSPAP